MKVVHKTLAFNNRVCGIHNAQYVEVSICVLRNTYCTFTKSFMQVLTSFVYIERHHLRVCKPKKKKKKKLKICTCNLQCGLGCKCCKFQPSINTQNPHLLVLRETHSKLLQSLMKESSVASSNNLVLPLSQNDCPTPRSFMS